MSKRKLNIEVVFSISFLEYFIFFLLGIFYKFSDDFLFVFLIDNS